MDTEKINLRIEQILKHYELTASSFADSIHVQRSSISHILKGRNKPSLEFVNKLVQEYPEVDLYWLLYGKGDFPKNDLDQNRSPVQTEVANKIPPKTRKKSIEKVMVFYSDGTFSSYNPD